MLSRIGYKIWCGIVYTSVPYEDMQIRALGNRPMPKTTIVSLLFITTVEDVFIGQPVYVPFRVRFRLFAVTVWQQDNNN